MEEKLKEHSKDINHLKDQLAECHTVNAVMCKDIGTIKEDLAEIKKNQKEYMDRQEKFMNDLFLNMDERYASRMFQSIVTKMLWGVAIFIGGVIGTALFKLIIK